MWFRNELSSLAEVSLYYNPPMYTYVFQVVSVTQVSPPKTMYATLLSPVRSTCPAHLIIIDLMARIVFGEEVQLIILVTLSPPSCYLVCLKSKQLPERPLSPSVWGTKLLTRKKKKKTTQNYISVLFRPVYFLITKWMTKDSAPNPCSHAYKC